MLKMYVWLYGKEEEVSRATTNKHQIEHEQQVTTAPITRERKNRLNSWYIGVRKIQSFWSSSQEYMEVNEKEMKYFQNVRHFLCVNMLKHSNEPSEANEFLVLFERARSEKEP